MIEGEGAASKVNPKTGFVKVLTANFLLKAGNVDDNSSYIVQMYDF